MKLPIITMDAIKRRGPCIDPLIYAGENWSGTALKVLRHPHISAKDKLWVVLHSTALPRDLLIEAACRFAERALASTPAELIDPRSKEAIVGARKYARGEISKQQLDETIIQAWAARQNRALCAAEAAAAAAAAAEAAEAVDGSTFCAAGMADYAARAAVFAEATKQEARQEARQKARKEQVKILVRLCQEYESCET